MAEVGDTKAAANDRMWVIDDPAPSHNVNTSRGPIIDEAALVAALTVKRIAGAGLDVFDTEPLPADHPFRSLDNVTALPHLGFATREVFDVFYGDMPEAIAAFACGEPIRVINQAAIGRKP